MTQRYANAPPPVVPPRGLVGILEGYEYEPGTRLDTSKFPMNMVLVNVYDVAQSDLIQRVNKFATANNNVLVGGVFHGGVEVYGMEWSYGFTEDERSGVGAVLPRTHPQHTYRTTVPMGTTKLNERQVAELLQRMAAEWPGREYDLIHNNCLTFCNALLEELGLRRLPGWVDRAARAASAVDQASKKVAAETHQVVQLVRSATAEFEGRARGLVDEDPGEVFESVRSEAAKAVASLGDESERLKVAAQARAQVLAGCAQEQVQQVGAELLRWSQDFHEDAAPLSQKAAELHGDLSKTAAAGAAALSDRLMSWGQAIGDFVGGDGMGEGGRCVTSSAPRRSVASAASGASSYPAAASLLTGAGPVGGGGRLAGGGFLSGGGLLGSGGSSESSGEEEAAGMVHATEEQLMRRSLLADGDEEECIGAAGAAGTFSRASRPAVLGRRPLEEEAPIDWLSGPEPTASTLTVDVPVPAVLPPAVLAPVVAPVVTQAVAPAERVSPPTVLTPSAPLDLLA